MVIEHQGEGKPMTAPTMATGSTPARAALLQGAFPATAATFAVITGIAHA